MLGFSMSFAASLRRLVEISVDPLALRDFIEQTLFHARPPTPVGPGRPRFRSRRECVDAIVDPDGIHDHTILSPNAVDSCPPGRALLALVRGPAKPLLVRCGHGDWSIVKQ